MGTFAFARKTYAKKCIFCILGSGEGGSAITEAV